MAVPGAFAPVNIDGRLYADGMLVRNLPIDVARQTCADVVIAVPVGNPGPDQQKLRSLLQVAGQAMNVAIDANERAQLATLTPKDVTVRVVLKDITSSDFDKIPASIPIGEAAAREQAASLSRYSLSPEDYARWRASLTKVIARPKVVIDEVRMSGFQHDQPEGHEDLHSCGARRNLRSRQVGSGCQSPDGARRFHDGELRYHNRKWS